MSGKDIKGPLKNVLVLAVTILVLAGRPGLAAEKVKDQNKDISASLKKAEDMIKSERKMYDTYFDSMLSAISRQRHEHFIDVFKEMDEVQKHTSKMMNKLDSDMFNSHFDTWTTNKFGNTESVKMTTSVNGSGSRTIVDLGSKELAEKAKVEVKDGSLIIQSSSESTAKEGKGGQSNSSFIFREFSLPSGADAKKVKIDREGSKIIISIPASMLNK